MRNPAGIELASFSLFRSVGCVVPQEEMLLYNFLNSIQDGEWEYQVNYCRKILEKEGIEAYKKERKRSLPALSFSARVKHRRKNHTLEEQEAVHSGLMQLDFDAKDHPGMTVPEIREIVQACPYVFTCFVSLSGKGVKGIALVSADFATHVGSWWALCYYFSERCLKLDPNTKDPLRLCFVSSDPDIYLNNEAEEVVPVEVPVEVPSSPRVRSDRAGTGEEVSEETRQARA